MRKINPRLKPLCWARTISHQPFAAVCVLRILKAGGVIDWGFLRFHYVECQSEQDFTFFKFILVRRNRSEALSTACVGCVFCEFIFPSLLFKSIFSFHVPFLGLLPTTRRARIWNWHAPTRNGPPLTTRWAPKSSQPSARSRNERNRSRG